MAQVEGQKLLPKVNGVTLKDGVEAVDQSTNVTACKPITRFRT